SSKALDKTKKIDIKMKVNKNAKAMIGQDEQEINEMIAALEKNSKSVDEQRIEIDSLLREAQETHGELEKEYDKYRNHEKQLMNEAKDKDNQRVKAATREAEEIINELRENRAKGETKKVPM